jgi:Putative transposase of IS4/5 family (DUF4096)
MPTSSISSCPSCPPLLGWASVCAAFVLVADRHAVAVLESLLAPPGNAAGRGGRPEKHRRRLILDAIPSVVRGGIAWRQLPVEFPPAASTV